MRLVLVPHDHLHIKQMRMFGEQTTTAFGDQIRRANSRSPSVTYVALGSHELECPRLVAADPFCGFLDGFDVFHTE